MFCSDYEHSALQSTIVSPRDLHPDSHPNSDRDPWESVPCHLSVPVLERPRGIKKRDRRKGDTGPAQGSVYEYPSLDTGCRSLGIDRPVVCRVNNPERRTAINQDGSELEENSEKKESESTDSVHYVRLDYHDITINHNYSHLVPYLSENASNASRNNR